MTCGDPRERSPIVPEPLSVKARRLARLGVTVRTLMRDYAALYREVYGRAPDFAGELEAE